MTVEYGELIRSYFTENIHNTINKTRPSSTLYTNNCTQTALGLKLSLYIKKSNSLSYQMDAKKLTIDAEIREKICAGVPYVTMNKFPLLSAPAFRHNLLITRYDSFRNDSQAFLKTIFLPAYRSSSCCET